MRISRFKILALSFLCIIACTSKEPAEIAVQSISLSATHLELIVGDQKALNATIQPSNATNKKITWTSSRPNVASVRDGVIEGLSEGNAVITATSADGNCKANCEVTVKSNVVPVTDVSLDKTEITLTEGDSQTLIAAVKPDNATDKAVSWSSSNDKVATVEAGKVTAVAWGTATITASAGGKSATCKVTVEKKIIPVTAITLDKTELAMFEGETCTLTATVIPEDATDKTITWSSSNKGVASVDNGVVKALTSGSSTITAAIGNLSASCTVTVYPKGAYIDEYNVNQGKGVTIAGITWAPVNCGYKPASGNSKGYAYGKLYQWGRKNGQGYGKPYYNPSDPYEDESTPALAPVWTGNNEDADANTFYYGQSEPYNWINKDRNFWNDGTEDTPVKNEMYDPCPKGWRVPTLSELSVLAYSYHSDLVLYNGVYGVWNSGNTPYSESVTDKIFLPASGGRFADNWFHGCGAAGRGDGGSYWVATPDGGGASTVSITGEFGSTYRAFGLAVRCCRDEVVQIVPISSLSLSKESASIYEGDQLRLTAAIQPQNANTKAVFWSSSKESVATVSSDGVVSGLSEGQATITATAGGKSAKCTITVNKKVIEVTSVTLDKTEITLTEGDSQTLIATVKPDNATDKTVTWTSSNSNVATVNAGKVTAIAEGTATVTATAGGKSAKCTITVNRKKIEVTSVTLNKTELSLAPFESETLIATVKPDDAEDKTVTWTSSNSYVASVNAGKVTGILQGTATITATAGGKSATCIVTVKIKTIEVTSVTLDKTEITLIEGDTQKLSATVMPDDATDKTVTWTSSNNNVATVDDGTVRAIAEGSATITATAGEKSATCTVVVIKQVIDVTSVSLDKTEISMNKGESRTLVATVKPDDATDKTVTWTSSNTNVAKVEGGKVTALSEGGAIISASAGNKTATCTVTVLGSGPVIKAVYSGIDLSSGGSCTSEGSLWKLTENTRLKVTLKNNSFDTITITGLSLICSRTNTAHPFSIGNQNLEGGKQFTTTVSLTETLYSPILEFTYQSGGNTLTARTTFTGSFDNSTTEPYPYDPFDPGFN